MAGDTDRAEALCEAVRRAHEARQPLRIVGSGSKAFLTRDPDDSPDVRAGGLLSVAEHRGIIDYRPEELVLTARAGTPLEEVEQALAEAGQLLPFEPPRFGGGGTLGGAVACGLSGPGRPWRGAVRDMVLGVEMANGRGERLRFGGQVMKNVAGYDVSRLQAGAFGTLGLILAVSVKVLPGPATEQTRVFTLDPRTARARCRTWARRPYPITATCIFDGRLWVRLSGAETAVAEAVAKLGGEAEPDESFWESLRDHHLGFLAGSAPGLDYSERARDTEDVLWRCSMPPAAGFPLAGCLVTWSGAERWWRPGTGAKTAMAALAALGGCARPFDGSYGLRATGLSAAGVRYAVRLREAFDPRGVLNPGLAPRLAAPEVRHAY